MNRREFVAASAALAATAALPAQDPGAPQPNPHGFPASVVHGDSYIETTPIAEYHNAPGARLRGVSGHEVRRAHPLGHLLHLASRRGVVAVSADVLRGPPAVHDRSTKPGIPPLSTPTSGWTTFQRGGHEDVCLHLQAPRRLLDVRHEDPRRSRANWTAPGGPRIEACDLAYCIMETPFRRDVVKELADAAHRRDIKIDLYFSHPDWYDADFRPYVAHPLQVPSSAQLDDCARHRIHPQEAGGPRRHRSRSNARRGHAHDGSPSRPAGRVADQLRHHRHGVPGHVARPALLARAAQDRAEVARAAART